MSVFNTRSEMYVLNQFTSKLWSKRPTFGSGCSY